MSEFTRYWVITPDDLPTDPDPRQTFRTRAEAEAFIPEFCKRYERQGYYKTAQCERIPVAELADRCHVEEFELERNVLANFHAALSVWWHGQPVTWVLCADDSECSEVFEVCKAQDFKVVPVTFEESVERVNVLAGCDFLDKWRRAA